MGCDGLKPDLQFERLKILFSVPSSIDTKKISKMKFFSAARKISLEKLSEVLVGFLQFNRDKQICFVRKKSWPQEMQNKKLMLFC